MAKVKGKKAAKGAAEKKKGPVQGKSTEKENLELSDDELKEVSGGVGFAAAGLSSVGNTSAQPVDRGKDWLQPGKDWLRGSSGGGIQ